VRSSSFETDVYTTNRVVTPGTESELIADVAAFVPAIEDWYFVSPAFKAHRPLAKKSVEFSPTSCSV
jgi:hypothetical protein